MEIGPRHIPKKFYKKILAVLPIACVDVVVACRGKFLLVRRKIKPAKGRWFTIGGRIIRGEKLEGAVVRHVKKETGSKKIKVVKQLGTRETIFKDSAHGVATHTINTAYLVKLSSGKIVFGGGDGDEFGWFSKIDKNWHPFVKEILGRAGFR